jgi:CheY-like chemotaxis protein
MMPSREEFGKQIANLYQHLYDLVYLRAHPLAKLLVPEPSIHGKERAWQLHDLLLEIIKELNPGPDVPAYSREWRRHRLMVLCYVDGMAPQAVAHEIAVSRRQYYREHNAAIGAIADLLWNRYVAHPPTPQRAVQPVEEKPPLSDLELLRLEAARLAQAERYTRIGEVVPGVISLFEERLHQRAIQVHLALPNSLPGVSLDRGLLRQVLVATLGYLIERASQARIHITVKTEDSAVCLSLTVEPPEAIHSTSEDEVQERLAAFEEVAALGNAHVLPLRTGEAVTGIIVRLPTDAQRTVLVVDDNADVLELFQRYLATHHYRIITAQTAREGLDLAIRLQPDIIVLDLMMPEQDGWDLLQALTNRPETQHTPVIVCTILKQKELALSLGATAFLKKPVTEQELVSALKALDGV